MNRLELKTKFASRIEQFRLDEFDVDVFLRPLSALDRSRVIDTNRRLRKNEDADNLLESLTKEAQCYIVSRGLVTQDGNPLYKPEDSTDIADDIPGKALDAISKKILEISGMGGDDAEKNSSPIPSEDSSAG